jgi:hypothetical protein
MKNNLLSLFILALCLFSIPAFPQTGPQTENDTALLGLPGDNLDLYAVLNIFQKSKTIEDFEKTLNLKETGLNNLDLDLNDTVDFIKVVTKQDKNDFTFILQVDVSAKEVQDVAVILVSKDKDGKVTMQIVGDKDLYGKDYVIEPKPATPAATPNPAYTGTNPATTSTTASSTTVVVVESAPIVQYVYSPVYVPYYPPYYYHYYPPYHAAFHVAAVSVYHHNNYYHHGGYYGGHGNTTVVVHNTNNYNNYNNSRNSSNTVNNNNNNGNYNRNNVSNSNRASNTSASSNKATTSQSKGSSASAKPSTSQSKTSSTSAKPTSSQTKSSSASRSNSSGSSRSGGGRRR